jgi:hypothetical protein
VTEVNQLEYVTSDSATVIAVFAQFAKVFRGLSDEEVQRIVTGETQIKLVPKGSQVAYPLDLPGIAAEKRTVGSQDEVVQILNRNSRGLNVGNLRKLADELNIDVPSSAKSKGPCSCTSRKVRRRIGNELGEGCSSND